MTRNINILIFGVLSLLLIIFGNTSPVRSIRGYVQSWFVPISGTSYRAVNATTSTTSILGAIKDLATENNRLKSENEVLQAQVVGLKEVQERLNALEKESNLSESNKDQKYLAAAVVGRSPSAFRNVLTIDKGKDDGIVLKQPVLSSGFLIGRVSQVFSSSSQIELITNHRFVTPVVLQDSRLLGLMKGGLQGLQIEQLPIDGTIKPGEQVITSGLAGELPAGLPIGKVDKVVSKPSDIFQSITVSSPVNLGKIEIVLVLLEKV